MERRQFSRLLLHSDASIKQEKVVIMGVVENLSMKGAFIRASEKLPVGGPVMVTICTNSTPNYLCDLRATVVRVADTGFGLQFEKTLLD